MKATGIVRKIDELGRVVLPKEMRTVMNLPEGTQMEIFTENDTIILRKYQASGACPECGKVGEELLGKSVKICKSCVSELYTKEVEQKI